MKTFNFRYLSVLFFINTFQAQEIQWEKSCGGKHDEYLSDVKATADYGFILVGSSLSRKSGNKKQNNNGDLDFWIWKMDENGELDWQKNFGGSGSDFLQGLALTSDAGYILGGTSNSNKSYDKSENSKGGEDYWIIKLSATGGQEWQKTIGGNGQDKLQCILQTRDGGYMLGGSSSSEPSNKIEQSKYGGKTTENYGNLDYWIVKLDKKGAIEWQETYGGIYVDELRGIEQTVDGGYILGGYSNSPSSGNKIDNNKGIGDYWILKIDKKGAVEWQKTIGGSMDDQLFVLHQTYDKGFILGGNSNSSIGEDKTKDNSNGTDFWIVKLDTDGKILWQETYDYGNVDNLTSLVENLDNTILIGGFAHNGNTIGKQKVEKGTDDYIALKINETGTVLWDKVVGSDGKDILKKVIETRDGGYLMAGTSNPFPNILTTKQNEGKKTISSLQGNNSQVRNAKKEFNDAIKKQGSEINKSINKIKSDIVKKTKGTLDITDKSPLKIESNKDALSGGILNGIGDFNSAGLQEKKLPSSRDKNANYGNSDFWVVKLKDENKKEKVKLTIEAAPNPTQGYTNIIIGYEFDSGTATVVDLAGRVIQKIEITSRTVPINLTTQPEGIYIVNINTNVQSDGIKIIKGISKN